ncbi:MAG: tRNA (adenosine(37)-N6)-threonylcarbamoyltransferase complex dimerization subunit type 1 TsaB [Nitrospirales bacterium]|nr:tRNA (adenosine(37)-N6)-threonylcarbamoyltransferase complex dimerization subunit type 1 TsaB [Nitrospirales bacterium]
MVILAVETGTASPSVAILKDRTLLASSVCQPGQSLTSQLLPTIDRLLVSVGLRMTDCQGLAVSIGPGSFTGLRVGLATVSALRLALQIPLVGVSTLEGLAWNQAPVHLPIFSTVYIKPGFLYWGCYQWEGATMTRRGNEAMGTVADSLKCLKGNHLVVGDGWSRNRELFVLEHGELIPSSPDPETPSAQGIGLAGFGLLERGQLLPEGTSPQYLQPSYAEVAIGTSKVSGG